MIRNLTYNLPGYGFASCYLLGQAVQLMDMFESYNIIDKMKNTCQLGTMKYVYPGAHHTRYEYAFTQLMLISNVASSSDRRSVELSLSSNLSEYDALGQKISGSALMQCLALLSNAGHMYDTFTASKILIRLLAESKKEKTPFYSVYKRNLPREIQQRFDELLKQGNHYKLHLFHIIHVLQGMRRSEKNRALCDLCIKLVTQLIDPNLITNESTHRIFFLYKKIRKIAYLSVDMVYTPASFGANLSRMIYSIPSYVDNLFDENSAMNSSIQQLEAIIHQQIYNSTLCILNSARIEQEYYLLYRDATNRITDIVDLRKLLVETDAYQKLHSTALPKSIHNLSASDTLLLSKKISTETEGHDLSSEAQIASRFPLSRIAYGTQLSQNLQLLYTSYGLLSQKMIQEDTQSIISNAVTLHRYDDTNKIDIVKFAIQSLYKYGEFFFNFTAPKGLAVNDCVFIGSGCKKIAAEIRKQFTDETVSNRDQLHEILSCAHVLESISYSGMVICFVGGIKATLIGKTVKIDELDGFIYLPNKDYRETFAYIIEAKNYAGGENEARKQLQETRTYLSQDLSSVIEFQSKCAFLKIDKYLSI